jgi:hypothetical protein
MRGKNKGRNQKLNWGSVLIIKEHTSIQMCSLPGDEEQWQPEVETHKSSAVGKPSWTRAMLLALMVAGRRIERRRASRAAQLHLNRQPAGLHRPWQEGRSSGSSTTTESSNGRGAALWRGITARRAPIVRESCGLGGGKPDCWRRRAKGSGVAGRSESPTAAAPQRRPKTTLKSENQDPSRSFLPSRRALGMEKSRQDRMSELGRSSGRGGIGTER